MPTTTRPTHHGDVAGGVENWRDVSILAVAGPPGNDIGEGGRRRRPGEVLGGGGKRARGVPRNPMRTRSQID